MSSFWKNTSQCLNLYEMTVNRGNSTIGIQPNLEVWQLLIAIGVIAVFCFIIAKVFNFIRSKVYQDQDNVDTAFDAGGKVSLGLTASTIVSQWTWAATLLQSSSVGSKYGISGPFWYASGATIQILLFSMLSVQLKIRAPGAKTFLQVIMARFGKKTHLVFCIFGLTTNVIVTAMLMLGGAAVMTNLVRGLTVELATALVAAVIGTYTFVGGLGATFYVSYFNTAVIYIIMLIFLLKVYFSPGEDNALGDIETVYHYLNCSIGPEGNKDESYLTILSYPGLMFGIINIVGNFGTVFVDQSYWQSSVAAKPRQGVLGFLSGGIAWFAVPFTFATTMGLAYIALSAVNDGPLLSDDDVNAGLVVPVVAQKLMGASGEVLVLVMILMAVCSTGSAEVIAVTSICVYDFYQLHYKPYRAVHDANSCILCGKQRGPNAPPKDKCFCVSMTYCPYCAQDEEMRRVTTRAVKPDYKCVIHGNFRKYNEYLSRLKDWAILWTVLAIFPLTLVLNALRVSLGWVYLSMGVLVGSAVIPITLSMTWTRLTGVGMCAGAIGGCILGLSSWLVASSAQPGGLEDFFTSTGAETSMLVGNLCSIVSGCVITVVVSLLTGRNTVSPMSENVWENTRDIDSPLSPWTELYAKDLGLTSANKLDNRPSLQDVADTFKMAKYTAYIGATVLTFILIILWPAIQVAAGVFTLSDFQHWINLSAAWGILAAIFIIVMPIASEAWEIRGVLKEKSKFEAGEMEVAKPQLSSPLGSGCGSRNNLTYEKAISNALIMHGSSRDLAVTKEAPRNGQSHILHCNPDSANDATTVKETDLSSSEHENPRAPVFE